MNRIFKVVFNQVLGRQAVVSELASSVQRGVCKAVVVAALAVAAGGAWANDIENQSTKSRVDNDATISTATNAYGSTASGWAGENDDQITDTGASFSSITTGAWVTGSTASGFATRKSQIYVKNKAHGSTASGNAENGSKIYTGSYAFGAIAMGYADSETDEEGNVVSTNHVTASGKGSIAIGHDVAAAKDNGVTNRV